MGNSTPKTGPITPRARVSGIPGVSSFDLRRVRRHGRKAAMIAANRQMARDLAQAETAKRALSSLVSRANDRARHETSLWGRLRALLTFKVW